MNRNSMVEESKSRQEERRANEGPGKSRRIRSSSLVHGWCRRRCRFLSRNNSHRKYRHHKNQSNSIDLLHYCHFYEMRGEDWKGQGFCLARSLKTSMIINTMSELGVSQKVRNRLNNYKHTTDSFNFTHQGNCLLLHL